MLFHEIYSSYYLAAASILREAVRGRLTGKEMNALVQKHAFGESLLTIPDGLKGGKWRLLHTDFSTPLEEEPSMPLTKLEKRWMKSLLLDPRIQLFSPDMTGLEDVDPLFTPDTIVYYDRYSDGDDYQNPDYIRHFDTILCALRENRNLYISFESRRLAQPKLVVTPQYLEYSEKDDRFRLSLKIHIRDPGKTGRCILPPQCLVFQRKGKVKKAVPVVDGDHAAFDVTPDLLTDSVFQDDHTVLFFQSKRLLFHKL